MWMILGTLLLRYTMIKVDKITLGVIQAGLQQVCDEMDLSFSRSAFSPVISEANDRSNGIYSAINGSLISQGYNGLPVFVGTMEYSTSEIIRLIKEEKVQKPNPGDIYIVNDQKKLIGQCPLNKLLTQKENISIGEIMIKEDIKYLSPDAHWKEVAELMSKYNLINIPIINIKNHELLGIVSVDDILPWLLNER